MDFTGERFVPESKAGGDLEAEHLLRYHSIAELARGKVVLDAASGEGYGSEILSHQARQVYGVEIDTLAVTQARNKYHRPNLNFIQGSVGQLPFPDAIFDLVVSFETIEHVSGDLQEAFLGEIKRLLRPTGMLVMSTPDKRIYADIPQYHNEFHVKEFYRDEFLAFLSRVFKNVCFWEQTEVLAYVLTPSQEGRLRQVLPTGELEGKYIVAFCSDVTLPESPPGSIIFDKEDLYHRKVTRVVELQGEIDIKNGHLFRHEDDVMKKEHYIEELGEYARKMQSEMILLHKSLEEGQAKIEREEECRAQADAYRVQAISELETLRTSCQVISEELAHIKATLGWRILQALYRIKKKIW